MSGRFSLRDPRGHAFSPWLRTCWESFDSQHDDGPWAHRLIDVAPTPPTKILRQIQFSDYSNVIKKTLLRTTARILRLVVCTWAHWRFYALICIFYSHYLRRKAYKLFFIVSCRCFWGEGGR